MQALSIYSKVNAAQGAVASKQPLELIEKEENTSVEGDYVPGESTVTGRLRKK